jgi:hypothetical protein
MKPARPFSAAIAVFILVALIALAAPPAQASAEGHFQRDLKVTGPVDLNVTTGSGSIVVKTGAADVVKISGHIRVNAWFDSSSQDRVHRLEQNPPIEQNGNSIRIGQITDPELKRNVSIRYEITVPAQTELHSNTGSGDQTVEGIRGPADVGSGSGELKLARIGGGVHAKTGSGDVALDEIQGNVRAETGSGSIHAKAIAGGFEARTGSGDVRLEQTAAGAVRADTGSGNVELRNVRGSLEARTGSGEVEAEGHPDGRWLVHTGSGGVRLALPMEAAFDLDAHTSSGSIKTKHPVTVEGSLGRKELRGKVRGGGVPIEVHTGSGDIEIN